MQIGKLKAIIAEHMRQHNDVYAKDIHNKAPTALAEDVKDPAEYLTILTGPEPYGRDIELLAADRKFDWPILLLSYAGDGKSPRVAIFHRGGKKKPLALYNKRRHIEWLEGKGTKEMILEAEGAQPDGLRGAQATEDEIPPTQPRRRAFRCGRLGSSGGQKPKRARARALSTTQSFHFDGAPTVHGGAASSVVTATYAPTEAGTCSSAARRRSKSRASSVQAGSRGETNPEAATGPSEHYESSGGVLQAQEAYAPTEHAAAQSGAIRRRPRGRSTTMRTGPQDLSDIEAADVPDAGEERPRTEGEWRGSTTRSPTGSWICQRFVGRDSTVKSIAEPSIPCLRRRAQPAQAHTPGMATFRAHCFGDRPAPGFACRRGTTRSGVAKYVRPFCVCGVTVVGPPPSGPVCTPCEKRGDITWRQPPPRAVASGL